MENLQNEKSSSQTTSSAVIMDLTQVMPDLEELTPVVSGPAYSIFTQAQKRWIVFMVTYASFLSPASANIYFPALNPLSQELGVSTVLINLTLTSYMIFQGLAPTIFGDFADMAGRRPAYLVAAVIYLAANIGLAFSNSYAALFLLRCLQSTGSSGAVALGMGVVADMSTSSERGSYMGIVGTGTMIGPSIAPVIGGLLTQFLDWRAIFWFLTIMSVVWLVPFFIFFPETARNIVGNGSIPAQGWNMSLMDFFRNRRQPPAISPAAKGKLYWPNPLKTMRLLLEKDVALILFYNSLIYTAYYDIMASLPALFSEIYGFNNLQVGLCYIPFGIGCCISSYTNGIVLDYNYRRVARQHGFSIDKKRGDDISNFPIEQVRLQIVWPMLTVGLACVLAYGWVLEYEVSLAAPLILQFFVGFCVNGAFNILGVLLVDLYPYVAKAVLLPWIKAQLK